MGKIDPKATYYLVEFKDNHDEVRLVSEAHYQRYKEDFKLLYKGTHEQCLNYARTTPTISFRFYDDLQRVKEQLFDAPIEVKEAFNTVVRYFSWFKRDEGPKEYYIVEVFNAGSTYGGNSIGYRIHRIPSEKPLKIGDKTGSGTQWSIIKSAPMTKKAAEKELKNRSNK